MVFIWLFYILSNISYNVIDVFGMKKPNHHAELAKVER